jgi:hypothetical protein
MGMILPELCPKSLCYNFLMAEDENERRVKGVKREAIALLETIENDFLREALVAMFDVKDPSPDEHSLGLIRVCKEFDKTSEEFMIEWRKNEHAKKMTLKALQLLHGAANAPVPKTRSRIIFWLRVIVYRANMLIETDKEKQKEFAEKARDNLMLSDLFP